MSITSEERVRIKELMILDPCVLSPPQSLEFILRKIRELPPGSKILEMGTFIGGSACKIAQTNPDIIIHSVDLNDYTTTPTNYQQYLPHVQRHLHAPQLTTDDLPELQQMQTEDYPQIILHTGNSRSLGIQNFSLVYIDANHTAKEVFLDLNYAWDCVDEGSYIMGDDVNFATVYNAWNKFALVKNVELTIYGNRAMIKKIIANAKMDDNLYNHFWDMSKMALIEFMETSGTESDFFY
jgi:predicted O-methyltransferase YrrM